MVLFALPLGDIVGVRRRVMQLDDTLAIVIMRFRVLTGRHIYPKRHCTNPAIPFGTQWQYTCTEDLYEKATGRPQNVQHFPFH